jgi:hypothetical protein
MFLHWHAELASLGCRLNDQIAEGQMGQGVSIKRVPKRSSPLVLVGAGNPAGVPAASWHGLVSQCNHLEYPWSNFRPS